MFSKLRGFLNRHRRKFVFGSLIVGGAVLATQYTQRKLREWQENETRAFVERTKRQQHFESTERTCNQTILSLVVGLREAVTTALDTESIVEKLRDGTNDKLPLWNELKVLAIARSAALIYSCTMLIVTLRIQLNLIGGYMFKDSMNLNSESRMNSVIQQKYLSLCQYFMEEGAIKLSLFVKEKVEESTAAISLKQRLTLRDLEQIYWSISSSVTADALRDPIQNLGSYVMPPNCETCEDNLLSQMISETLDLLETTEVQSLVQSSVRMGFVTMVDHISEYFFEVPSGYKENLETIQLSAPGLSTRSDTTWSSPDNVTEVCYTNGFLNLNKTSMPMAKIIPILNGHVPAIPRKGDGSSLWVQNLILNDKLKTLGANVYEAFSF